MVSILDRRRGFFFEICRIGGRLFCGEDFDCIAFLALLLIRQCFHFSQPKMKQEGADASRSKMCTMRVVTNQVIVFCLGGGGKIIKSISIRIFGLTKNPRQHGPLHTEQNTRGQKPRKTLCYVIIFCDCFLDFVRRGSIVARNMGIGA